MTEKEVIAQTIVDIIGGTSYDGEPTDIYNYIQRLRILVEREEKMKCCANCNQCTPDGYCTLDETETRGWEICDDWTMDRQKMEMKE